MCPHDECNSRIWMYLYIAIIQAESKQKADVSTPGFGAEIIDQCSIPCIYTQIVSDLT